MHAILQNMTILQGNMEVCPTSMTELVELLSYYNIPIEKYGIGVHMPLQAILEQLENKEFFFEVRNGHLFRNVKAAGVNVYFYDQSDLWKLYEDRLVYLDQESKEPVNYRKVKRRPDWSVGHKIALNESPRSIAKFAVGNELGIQIDERRLINEQHRINYRGSYKYPGIKNHIRIYEFDLYLRTKEFRKEGYTYEDRYARSYFTWRKID